MEKDKQEFVPMQKKHANILYKAEPGRWAGLHVTAAGDYLISVWKLQSVWQRVLSLFTGELSLILLGGAQPPCCIVRGDSAERLGVGVK